MPQQRWICLLPGVLHPLICEVAVAALLVPLRLDMTCLDVSCDEALDISVVLVATVQ